VCTDTPKRVYMRRILLVAVVAVVAALAAPSLIQADTVNFDNVVAPSLFPETTYSPFVTPSITFTNGVVLNDIAPSNFDFLATTAPNLYATTDIANNPFFVPANGPFPSTVITGTFTNGTGSGLSLDVINGASASTFTVNLYDALNNLIDSATISLNGFGSAGNVGRVAFFDSGISYFTVTSGQTSGPGVGVNYAIDTVNFTTTPTAAPEPASLALLGTGLLGLIGFKRSRKTA
jgi:PEP-CTERM motif